jgi:Glyoxal oxidase N-terminus
MRDRDIRKSSIFVLSLICTERDMKRMRCGSYVAVLVVAFAINARAQTLNVAAMPPINEDDRPAPVDYGFGPGVMPSDDMRAAQEMATVSAAAPVGGADAQTKGVFGPPVTWPIIAIHEVLLPDGRVMSYGTGEQGGQGAGGVYDVWNPKQGTSAAAHTVLPNTTGTDIFCAGQSVMAGSGELLIVGGDLTIAGKRNFSNQQTTIFRPNTNQISATVQMRYARWYPTVVALPTGEMLVLGGRQDKNPTPASTPEAFRQGTGWRTLMGATSDAAFGTAAGAWYYPNAVLAPNGDVFVLGNDGKMFFVDPTGDGRITQLAQRTLGAPYNVPTVMFAPGKVLSVRSNKRVIVVDLNGSQPAITTTADLSQLRIWSNATVLADGKVLVTGGSAVGNN